MEGRGIADHQAQIPRMQEGVRQWVRRHGASRRSDGAAGEHAGTEGRTRRLPPLALLAALTASACCPLLTIGDGVLTLTGAGLVSAMGTGVLSGLLTSAIDRARDRRHGAESPPGSPELEEAIASQIRAVLAVGDDRARALRADIATMLRQIDAGGVAVRAVMETGHPQLGRDIVTALGDIGDQFGELRFLVQAVARTGLSIRDALDEQGADVRTVIDQNYRQATSIRLILDTVRAIEMRTRDQATAPARSADTRPLSWTRGCPYRGLLPFGEDDADVFYGRELLTAELTVTVSRQMASGGMVVITGASGAGKSSLIRAGLLPALARGEAGAGSGEWALYVITPGENPLDRLAAPLEAMSAWQGRGQPLREMLVGDPVKAAAVLRQAIEVDILSRRQEVRETARMVLVVDQFEQLFTLQPGPAGEAERQAFITALCALGTEAVRPGRVPPAFVVIAVRGDFWARCAEYPPLAPHLRDGQFVVGPMTESELRLAISGPAEAAELRIEESLPDTIVRDLRAARARSGTGAGPDNSGVLPLLAEAMRQTWDYREGNRLTSRGYARAGGVSQAVRNRADAVYDALPPPQQAIAREVLRRMTVAGQDGEFARRPADRAELHAGHPAADVDAVLETLADARLVILDQQSASISHDVLLHAWPRLHGWLDRDRGALILYGQMAEDAAEWHSHGTDTSYLYRGAQLAGIREAAAIWSSDPGRYPSLTGQQRAFLDASTQAQAGQARRRRAIVIALAALALISVLSGGAAGLAARAQHAAAQNATRQASLALSGELAAESEQLDTADPTTAAKLAAASWQIAPTSQAQQSMLDVLAQPERGAVTVTNRNLPVATMAFARRGQILITGGEDGRIREWDVATRHEVGPPLVLVRNPTYLGGPPGPSVPAMAISPSGDMLATEGADAKVHLWNLASRRKLGAPTPGGGGGGETPLLFSPDSRTLAITGNDGTVLLLDVASRKVTDLNVGAGPGANALAFSPDGTMLAIANGPVLQLWSVATGREVAGPVDATGSANRLLTAVAFSPDGKTLATGSGKLRLWEAPSLRPIGAPITASTGELDDYVPTITFSPDGRLVATGGGDGTVRLWNVASHRQVGPTLTANLGGQQHDYSVNAVVFSPDGATLATAGNDGFMRLWNLDVYQQIGSSIPATGTSLILMEQVAFSPSGKLIATAEQDGTIRLWNVVSHRQAGRAITDPGGANMLAFTPDGRVLAAGEADGKVLLWSVATQRQISPPMTVSGNLGLASMAFSPSGTILATGDQDGRVRLWNVATRRPIGPPLTGVSGGAYRHAAVNSVAFTPDGRLLATGRANGKVRLYSMATRRQVGSSITAVSDGVANDIGVSSLAFTPDGSILATADGDGTARLWNVATDHQIGPPITATKTVGDKLTSVAFTRGGSILITGEQSGAAKLWDVTTLQEIGPTITIPDGTYGILDMAVSPNGEMLATVGDNKGTAQLWNIAFPADLLHAVCTIAGSPLTVEEWNSYTRSQPYRKTCQ
jgi:WD40 repeat protein